MQCFRCVVFIGALAARCVAPLINVYHRGLYNTECSAFGICMPVEWIQPMYNTVGSVKFWIFHSMSRSGCGVGFSLEFSRQKTAISASEYSWSFHSDRRVGTYHYNCVTCGGKSAPPF